MAGKISLEDEKLSEAAVNGKESSSDLRSAFMRKKRRVDTHKIKLNDDVVDLVAEALPQREFDDLLASHPKRPRKQEDDMIGANSKTFPPALFARSVQDPHLSEEEWTEIWLSEDWSPGELGHLLNLVLGTTSRGFDIPFGAGG